MATTVPNRTALIVSPHLYLADVTGRPLDYGRVYFGEPNKDGEFYPINIFSDKELTEPLAQPVHTKGGFLHNNGDITEVFAYEGVYSVKVLDQYGRKIFFKGEVAKQTIEDATSDVVDAAQVEINKRMAQIDDAINTAAAAGAGANGWDDLLVNNIDKKPLRSVNIEQVDKIADLDNLTKLDKRTVIVKSYHAPIYALANPFKGGGTFIYDASKANTNDGGTCINGWVRQITQAEILATWFGAKGDGTTDDTDAIQKAVNACNALNKPLRIPKGEGLGLYRITKPISITQAISISGDGYNYSGLRCDGCDGFVIAKGINHVSIINMAILQSIRYSITANDFAAIKINGVADSNNLWNAFSNLFVDGFRYVVYGSYFWSTLFNNIISVYCGSGILAINKCVNNFINNCQLGGSGADNSVGIFLFGNETVSEGWVITNNLLASFEESITGYATSHVTVSNNILDFCGKRGVSMLDGANGASLNWTVSDNYIATANASASTAIYSLNNQTASANQNRGHNIKGNDIVAYSGASFTYGIRTEGTAEQNTSIDGNRVDTKGGTDCSINGNAKNTVVTNNRWLSGGFYNNTSSYIVYDNNTGVVTSSADYLIQKRGKTTVYQGSAAPTSGTYVVGDIMWNTAPNSGQPVGWVYSVGSAWKPFGVIS